MPRFRRRGGDISRRTRNAQAVYKRRLNRTEEERLMENAKSRERMAHARANENQERRNERLRANAARQRYLRQRITTDRRAHDRKSVQFDAGAPAVQQNRLMGVMSFGPEKCGHEFQPAVFIKAFYFRDFVRTTIASYKTTSDLIEAMREVDPLLQPPVHIKSEDEVLEDRIDEVTPPDYKHD